MTRPNIVLVLTDHLRHDVVDSGHMPRLASVASDGVRFENACCGSPLCQPSRVSMVTGLFPSQTGVCGNQSPPVRVHRREDTFVNHLRRSGYATALVGKHHFIDRWALGVDVVTEDHDEVVRYGFDHVEQVLDEYEHRYNQDTYTRHLVRKGLFDTYRQALAEDASTGRPNPLEPDDTVDGYVGCRAAQYLENAPTDKPFYLNVSFVGPHPPYWHPGSLEVSPEEVPPPVGAEDTPEVRRRRAHYYTRCRHIDRYIGRLVDTLERRGVAENTLVVLTSDHGDMLGDFGIFDKRHFRRPSVGVPMVAWGAGVQGQVRQNGVRRSKALVSTMDLYPTFLDVAGLGMPETARRWGRSLTAAFAGRDDAVHDALFAQLGTCVMIRTPRWKMVFDPGQGGAIELYNLAVDPQEMENLAGRPGYQATVAELTERLLSHRIGLTQTTHAKEHQRLQQVHVPVR